MEIIHISQKPEDRILKPKRNFAPNQDANAIKKCLFGAPDPDDIQKMLQEQIQDDWERIRANFGIDLEDIENMENVRMSVHTPTRKGKVQGRKIVNAKRRKLFNPYNDRKITDFYQARKNAALLEKKDGLM